jgi:DNA-binding transcriptional LysR family regulator
MELRHLRYFVMTAEERNVSRAAARLYVTQPAISRQLKELEAELGVTLFRREHHGIRLTEAGEALLGHAREILKQTQRAIREVKALGGTPAEPLRVGYVASAPTSYLTGVLRQLNRHHPEVEIELREMQPGDQVEALAAGELDVALIGEPCAEVRERFEVRVVKRLPLRAVLPDDHALARRKAIDLAELAGETFLGLSPRRFPGRNEMLRQAGRAAGFEPKLRTGLETVSAALGLVAAGRGVTLLPSDTASLPHSGAVFVRLRSPRITVESVAAWRKDAVSAGLSRFVETLCAAVAASPKT